MGTPTIFDIDTFFDFFFFFFFWTPKKPNPNPKPKKKKFGFLGFWVFGVGVGVRKSAVLAVLRIRSSRVAQKKGGTVKSWGWAYENFQKKSWLLEKCPYI
jgi:hypothetical protein